MAKSINQKFLSFKKRHQLSNEDIVKIATEYANSSFELARTHFTNKYNITDYVFYQIRDYAIICCLVNRDLYERIKEKSSANYKSNNTKNSSASSIAHFDKLLVQQSQFLSEFSEKEILEIGLKYAEGVTVKKIAMAYETGELAIKKLLGKGIVNIIYDIDLVNQIKRIVGPTSLTPLLKMREANKNILINCHQHRIAALEMQVRYYDMFFRFESDKPSLESLENELKLARKKYKETLKL